MKPSIKVVLILLAVLVVLILSPLRVNVSSSLPHWVYLMTASTDIKKGDVIAFCIDKKYEKFVAQSNRFDCPNKMMALAKIVIANAGDRVAINDTNIIVNDKPYVAKRLQKSITGNKLPAMDFSETILSDNQYIVYTPAARSFDSRYFGVITADNVIGELKGW